MAATIMLPKINSSMPYHDYKNLVLDCAAKNITTGVEQLQERIEATKMNAQRMKRLDKQIIISDEIIKLIENTNKKWLWLVLAESWCGDGAQNIPVIAKIAGHSPNIELKVLLRDENPEIMDAYLTNSSRSIPKMICVDALTLEEIGIWGPRPVNIQNMVKEFKKENPETLHDEFVKNLHLWYAKDKGESIQEDFEILLSEWILA